MNEFSSKLMDLRTYATKSCWHLCLLPDPHKIAKAPLTKTIEVNEHAFNSLLK